MKQIITYPIKDQNLKKCLVFVGDLVYTDEPILSLFKDERNDDLFLFDWVDADTKTNRWLVYKIESQTLSQFIQKEISFKGMISTIRNYLVADIDDGSLPPFDIRQINNLPHGYYPDTDLTFNEEYTRDLDDIKSVLDTVLKLKEKQNSTSRLNANIIRIGFRNYHFDFQPVISPDDFLDKTSSNKRVGKIPFSELPHQNENKHNSFLRQAKAGLLAK